MQWEKTTGRKTHCCEGTINGVPARFTVHTGRIETGRSRMFIGFFASVEIDGEPVTGNDSSGIVFALGNCAEILLCRTPPLSSNGFTNPDSPKIRGRGA